MNSKKEIEQAANIINKKISSGSSVIPEGTKEWDDITAIVDDEIVLNLGCKKVTRGTFIYYDLPEHEIEEKHTNVIKLLYGHNH